VEGRGGREKEEKEGEAHGEEGRRADTQDLQRRAHRFAEEGTQICREEGTRFCTGGGHTAGGNGLTSFSYLLSVHANCLMKCLIEMFDRMLDEMLDRMLDEMLSHPFKMLQSYP
jgi:hypothetical protein